MGLTDWSAQRIGLPVDLRRSTTNKENVETLKEYLEERHTELEEKRRAGRAKRRARVEAKRTREPEMVKIAKEEAPVTMEEVVPIEVVDLEEPEAAEEEVVQADEEPTPLSDLEGMTANEIEALNVQEIEYADDLLGLSAEDMDEIAATSGIKRERIEVLVFQAIDKLEQFVSLTDVPDIGEKTAKRLEHLGIHSANQLARLDPNIEVEGLSTARLKTFIEKAWEQILNA